MCRILSNVAKIISSQINLYFWINFYFNSHTQSHESYQGITQFSLRLTSSLNPLRLIELLIGLTLSNIFLSQFCAVTRSEPLLNFHGNCPSLECHWIMSLSQVRSINLEGSLQIVHEQKRFQLFSHFPAKNRTTLLSCKFRALRRFSHFSSGVHLHLRLIYQVRPARTPRSRLQFPPIKAPPRRQCR